MSGKRKNSGAPKDTMGDIRFGLDGLLGVLGDVISEVSERLEAGEAREVHRSFEVDTGKGPVRAEAGLRVRFADVSGGQQSSKPHSMTRPVNPERKSAPKREAAPAARTIDYEIVEDGATWRLIADIPGVDREDLSLTDDDGELVIETAGARRFHATCPMPADVLIDDLDVSLRNGILELTAIIDETGSA